MKTISTAAVIIFSLLSAGCSSSGEDESGQMSLRITDAPIDEATSVVVEFSEVQIRGSDATQNINFKFDTPKSIDLLALQGLNTESLFSNETVPAGVYNEVRLLINAQPGTVDSYIVLQQGGQQHELTVPSGSESGLKVKGTFSVPVNGSSSFTVDFDVRKSIVMSGNANSANGIKYHLKPVLRLVEDSQVGSISGSVDSALVSAASCSDSEMDTHNAVYVFSSAGVTPDDIDADAIEPVISALVKYDATSDSYRYQAAFLLAGSYTIAFTCNADAENIETDDDLQFGPAQDVTVAAGENSTASF